MSEGEKACSVCKKPFLPRRKSQRICSKQCNLVRNAEFQRSRKIDRTRKCLVCGESFSATHKATFLCSIQCQTEHFSRKMKGNVSQDTKIKMSLSGKAWRKTNPEWENRRREAAKAATQSYEYRQGALERYRLMKETQTGICSEEIRTMTANINKWVLKKAREALELETDFVQIWTDTLERLRREMPYDGPLGTADYFDYCSKIGKAMTADPALRKIQDDFMKEAIPRFYAARKEGARP